MKNLNKKVDIFFLLMLIEIFVLISFFVVNVKFVTMTNYFLLGAVFFLMVISYYTEIIVGLFISLFSVFVYGSYLLYRVLIGGGEGLTLMENYIWLIVFPILAFTSGKLGEYMDTLRRDQLKLQNEVQSLITIDQVTNLSNKSKFYRDLAEEMSRAKRHGFDLCVMLIEMQYYEEFLSIHGMTKVNEILNLMAEKIGGVTRDVDKRYKLEEDSFAVILPNTDPAGAEIVKDRLRKQLDDAITLKSGTKERLSFSFKIALQQYDGELENPFEYKELLKKELEYDV